MRVLYPLISIEEWIKIHPSFADDLPMACTCGKPAENPRPYVSDDFIGLGTGLCGCGLEDAVGISEPRTTYMRNKLLSATLEIIK